MVVVVGRVVDVVDVVVWGILSIYLIIEKTHFPESHNNFLIATFRTVNPFSSVKNFEARGLYLANYGPKREVHK